MLAGLLLAAFAPAYYFAARIAGYREFLYPALLLVLAYHLLLHGMGVAVARQPICSLIPIGLIYLGVLQGRPRRGHLRNLPQNGTRKGKLSQNALSPRASLSPAQLTI